MRNFQQKKRFQNVMRSKPALVLLGIMVLFFAWGVMGFMGKMNATRENRKIAQNKLVELEEKKVKLSGDIAKLNTESGVEESIRGKFGLAKEGEEMIVVVEDKNQSKEENTESGGFLYSLIFWRNWFK